MRVFTRVALGAVCLAVAVTLPGCGGGGGGGGSIVGPSRNPVRSVISQRGWQLDVLEVYMADLSVTGDGSSATVDSTVEWTYATNDVDLYVTNTSCTLEMLVLDACPYVAHADSSTAKPERVSFTVAAAGNYRFWVVNFGPTRESGTIEVAMTQ